MALGVMMLGGTSKADNQFKKMTLNEICKYKKYINNMGDIAKTYDNYKLLIEEIKRRNYDCNKASYIPSLPNFKKNSFNKYVKKANFDLNKDLIHFYNDKNGLTSKTSNRDIYIDVNANIIYYHNSTGKNFKKVFESLRIYSSTIGRYSLIFSNKKKIRPIPWKKPTKVETIYSSRNKKFIKILVPNLNILKKTIENKYLNFHVTNQEYTNPTFWTGYWLNTNYNRTRISEKKKL